MLNTKRSLFMALLTVAGSECAKIATGIMAAMLLLCSCNHNIYMFDGYNNNGSRLAQQDAMLHQLRKDANLCVDKTHHYILTNDSIEALYCIGQYKQKADSISLISKQRFNNTSVLFKYNMYQIILVTMFLVSLFGVIFYHSFKKKQPGKSYNTKIKGKAVA